MLSASENGSIFMCVPVWAISEVAMGRQGWRLGPPFFLLLLTDPVLSDIILKAKISSVIILFDKCCLTSLW